MPPVTIAYPPTAYTCHHDYESSQTAAITNVQPLTGAKMVVVSNDNAARSGKAERLRGGCKLTRRVCVSASGIVWGLWSAHFAAVAASVLSVASKNLSHEDALIGLSGEVSFSSGRSDACSRVVVISVPTDRWLWRRKPPTDFWLLALVFGLEFRQFFLNTDLSYHIVIRTVSDPLERILTTVVTVPD
ncbi:hypothetical protein BJY52DRAFT_1416643 [Lactarius psammicola]|nr:hypothetical protein BJY52DRAFT_1416643 [Lactarius psammicola]